MEKIPPRIPDEDCDEFRQEMKMQGVTPLPATEVTHTPSRKKSAPERAAARHRAEHTLTPSTNVSQTTVTDPVGSNTALRWQRPGVQTKRFQKMQRGKIQYQKKLDLHNLKCHEAEQQVEQFLDRVAGHHDCVLIIHGKGNSERPPQIKNRLNQLLPNIPVVLAFCSAQQKDGGTGAIYVLLKKNR